MDFYDITRNDAFPDDDKWKGILLSNGSDPSQSRRMQYRLSHGVNHPLMQHNLGLDIKILNNAVNTFSMVSNKGGVISLLSEMAKSLSEFKQFNNTSSLIFSWFGTEKILNRMWNDLRKSEDFITHKSEIDNANKDDNGNVVPIRKYTVANKVASLHAANRINKDDKNELTSCRKARNNIAHSDNNKASEETSKNSLKLFIKLLNNYYALNIYLSFNYSTVVI